MLDRSRISGWKPFVAALYAVAMLTLGFAHSHAGMPSASGVEATSAQAAGLMPPDRSLTPICGQPHSSLPSQHRGGGHCDACSLTAAPGAIPFPPALPAPPRPASKPPSFGAVESVAEAAALEPQSRGPPLLS